MARWIEAKRAAGEDVPVRDVAASFQEAVVDVLTRKAVRACKDEGVDHLMIGGGVAANTRLRALAEERCERAGIRLRVPRPGLCTDNGRWSPRWAPRWWPATARRRTWRCRRTPRFR
ncbi:hypothetical protein NKH18_31115 [Streptomyces sp. M10(2022)]